MDGLSDCWWMPGKALRFGGASSGARATIYRKIHGYGIVIPAG
jgi:hypothetical protein